LAIESIALELMQHLIMLIQHL